MPEIVAAHLERVARELSEQIDLIEYGPEHRGFFEMEEVTKLLAAALAACAREEALEWDKTAQLHISRWTELEWRNERLRALERAVGEKA